MSYLPERFYSTDQIKQHSSGKTHFFDRDSMRFFSSRIGQNAYPTNNPFITLFVTSEKFEDRYSNYSEPRYYTIRAYDSRTGSIDTVGEFQAYQSSKTANRVAKELAPEWEYTSEDQHEYALLINAEYDVEKRRAIAYGRDEFYVSQLGTGYLNQTQQHFV